jgi:uncharacterized Zn finger protein
MEDAALDAGLLRQGRRFAGSGRVGPITVSPGRIAAAVEDPDGIYDVAVHLTELTGAEWDRLLDQVTAESGHLAALLDGEVPRSLVRSAGAAEVPLLPTIGDLESDCDCPDIGDPCQHAAAVCYQTAWLLDDDPFVLLLLRGRDPDELLDALGRRRTGLGGGPPDQDLRTTGATDIEADVDRPMPAEAAYAATPTALPAIPPASPRPSGPALPVPPELPPDALTVLVADATSRARSLLAQFEPDPALSEPPGAVRDPV